MPACACEILSNKHDLPVKPFKEHPFWREQSGASGPNDTGDIPIAPANVTSKVVGIENLLCPKQTTGHLYHFWYMLELGEAR